MVFPQLTQVSHGSPMAVAGYQALGLQRAKNPPYVEIKRLSPLSILWQLYTARVRSLLEY
jgi:hypothetical protein